jgi:hypothetical protein
MGVEDGTILLWANSGYSGRIWEFSIWGIGTHFNEMEGWVQFGEMGRKNEQINKQ